MNIETIEKNGKTAAVIRGGSDDRMITDVRSALDLMVSVDYQYSTNLVAIAKELICDDFFVLSTGLAGEILQKLINYGFKIAVYGDFSGYTSKPLHDFIYESNNGHDHFFVTSEEEAVERLTIGNQADE